MYLNLKTKMIIRQITNEDISNILCVHKNTVINKMHGKTAWTIDEAIKIRDSFFKGDSIETLFRKEKKYDNRAKNKKREKR